MIGWAPNIKIPVPTPFPLIAVRVLDWKLYTGQFSIKQETPFRPMSGWVAGWLIYEDEQCITIALEFFHDQDDGRCAVVIQKTAILDRYNLKPEYNYPESQQ